MNKNRRRWVLGAVIPAAVAALGLGPYLAYRSDLPDRVATHFGLSGSPDGSMTLEEFLFFSGTLMASGVGGCVAIALIRRRLPPMVAPGVSAVGAFIAAMGAGILATTAIDQRGMDRWQDATLAPWSLLVVIGGGVVMGALAAWVAASLPHRDSVGPAAAPAPMRLAAGERVFWSSTLSARWPLLLGLAVLLLAVGLAPVTGLLITVILVVSAAAVVTFSRIRVSADRSGLQLRYGFLGWPRTTVSIDRIAVARAVDIRPTEWGGWGYRGSLALMRRAAVVLRAGPGLRLDLHDGKVFAVTVDDPDQPARLLNAEVARLPSSHTPFVE